jgi:hypothetical protein
MAFTSSVPGTKAELVERWSGLTLEGVASTRFTGLTAVTAHDDILVSWGNPYPDNMPAVMLIIDDAKNHQLVPVAGLTQLQETYDISCYISVADHPRNARLTMWQRAYDLLSAVMTDIFRMNLESDMPSQVDIILPRPSHDSDAISADERENSIMFDLSVTARLS